MTTMMISDLPGDLVLEILSMVALKSTRTVRLTCKKWNDLSRSQSFRKMQIGKASAAAKEGESQMMAMMGYNRQDIYLKSIVFNGGDPYEERKGKLICADEQVKISQIYHCEGLLLCILRDDSRLMVWNPYLGEKRWIEHGYYHRLKGFSYALGYEDKKSHRSIKFLRFIDYFPQDHFFLYEMYDLDSGLWKTLDATPHWRVSFRNRGVSLKGNTYWPATERNLDNEEEVSVDSIICYDFTRERFGQLLPLPFSAGHHDYVNLSCVREEKLAVLLQHDESNPYELDIWITTKIEAQEVSWRKFLRVETGFDTMVPFISVGGFFVDEEKKIAIGFDEQDPTKLDIIGDAGYFRQLDVVLGDQHFRPHVFSYVPSLVQIKQPSGGDRKQQSKLEKRRYDEFMLRLAAQEGNQMSRLAARVLNLWREEEEEGENNNGVRLGT